MPWTRSDQLSLLYVLPCIRRRSEVEYGVDFHVSGHTHLQHTNTTFGETAFVISGGGGGITSEILPSKTGQDDGYGFMDVVIQHDAMYITRYSHGISASSKCSCITILGSSLGVFSNYIREKKVCIKAGRMAKVEWTRRPLSEVSRR